MSAEAIAHHRAKSQSRERPVQPTASPSPDPSRPSQVSPASAASDSYSLAPPPYPGGPGRPSDEKPLANRDEDDEADTESDEEQWELDEAAEAAAAEKGSKSDPNPNVPKGNLATPASVETLVKSFVRHHPPGPAGSGRALVYPVILPQRRPKKQSRGFVHAYAPLLGECGIDQEAWFDFLASFEQSIKVSPIFDVVNVAAAAVGFVPEPTAQIVSFAVQTADIIAQRTYGRYRNNSFVAQINEAFFKPQGLFCLLMTYTPAAPNRPVATFDLQSTVAKAVAGPEDAWSSKLRSKMAPTQGTTEGATQIPASAPLVYPQLDAAGDAARQSNWFKRSQNFVADYMDRRAQATAVCSRPFPRWSSVLSRRHLELTPTESLW